ncbi:hypothetical protein P1J78_13050 [Psychromarinibacter sp. C21-152]|uniref:Uncharacterized protein n=1 Tax=Psychromarinibacter sediminicola TaxID=3033385 RepID=A0AAE3NVD3_9RHOB|nr:hypothetical protein [Psychromarinibacter sediminicola]MDF0601665.1 hypothetical protein [Psychromarinibacter sediminicola]
MTQAAPYRALYAYTWDLAEEDPAALTARMDRLGLDTLAIAASYHAGKFIRPHGKAGRVYFPEDGVAHCRVTPERYGAIRPQIGALAAETDVLGTFCAQDAVAVSAWVVLLHNSRLGALHPGAVTRNAFGDPLHYSLCPSCPEVRDYAVTLCADIAERYPVRGLTLETPGWLPYAHGYHHEFALIGSSPRLEFYLGLCFCDHCRQGARAAGIDADALQARVRGRVDTALAAADEPDPAADRRWLESELVRDAELAAYLRWRCTVVTSLVAAIRDGLRRDATLHVIPSVNQPLALAWIEGSDLAALDAACDGLEVCFYSDAALYDHARVAEQIGRPDMRAVLRPTSPEHRTEASFAGTVAGFAAAGVREFGFYNHGHMRQSGLDRIGRALAAI